MVRKPDLIERLKEFNELSDAEKIEAQIAWLEKKIVEVLWAQIGAGSALVGGFVAWAVRELVGSHLSWAVAAAFVLAWLASAWWLHRYYFRKAPLPPPHTDFIGP